MKKFLLIFCLLSAVFATHAQITITEVLMPQYIQGTTTSGNTGRVPFVCRLTLNGLTPDSTYRYITRIVLATNSATNAGAGNTIIVTPSGNFIRPGTAPSNFNTVGDYGTFTASATGSYTGWFVLEPTANATRFIPGNELFVRIVLNDGAGGTAFANYPTAPSPVKVIDFNAAAPNNGTGIRSTAAALGTATNFVMLYDNDLGTGRPISSTFIEDDGTSGGSYAPFYLTSVNMVDKAWGTIIPNALPNGIRRIAQYNRATGALDNINISTTGSWPGVGSTVSTVNPTGGLTEIVLDGSLVTLPVRFGQFSGFATGSGNVLQWTTTTELNVRSFEIERSTDGARFSAIGSIRPSGITNGSSYNFTDVVTATQQHFYRIKAVNANGDIRYTSIVALGGRSSGLISVFPNPVQSSFTIKHAEAVKNANIRLLDMQGKIIRQWPVMQGAIQSSFNAGNIASGEYLLQFYNGSKTSQVAFIKQ